MVPSPPPATLMVGGSGKITTCDFCAIKIKKRWRFPNCPCPLLLPPSQLTTHRQLLDNPIQQIDGMMGWLEETQLLLSN